MKSLNFPNTRFFGLVNFARTDEDKKKNGAPDNNKKECDSETAKDREVLRQEGFWSLDLPNCSSFPQNRVGRRLEPLQASGSAPVEQWTWWCHEVTEGNALSAFFRGESRHKMDSKKRVSIPADFRRTIVEGNSKLDSYDESITFTIVYGDSRQPCLKCFTEDGIQEIDEAIATLDRSSPERKFLEYFFQTKSTKVQLDPTGRLVMPPFLREKLDIDSFVCFAGKGESFEIWNPKDYDVHQAELANMYWDGKEGIDPMSLIDNCR